MSSPKVAIITGGSSGMGFALMEHLVGKGWKVMVADLNPPNLESLGSSADNVLFHKTDVGSWEHQEALFKATFEWGGRIDFLAANAGIDDHDTFYKAFDTDVPPELNVNTVQIDLVAVMYGIRLFTHYARRFGQTGGKITVTSSAVGIYAWEPQPQYVAAKHGLVGLVRSLGPRLKKEGIQINVILPAVVPTAIANADFFKSMPSKCITPMTSIIKAYDTLIDDDDMSGECIEVSGEVLYYRKQAEFANDSQRFLFTDYLPTWKAMFAKKLGYDP